MAIVTVTGTIEREAAGIVLPHEHVFIDLTNQYRQSPEATKSSWSYDKVGLENRDILSRNPLALRDNLIIDDIDCAEREVLEFKRAGGGTIVDASSRGLGRDPVALRAVALSVGINLIAGSAYYYRDTHPEDMSRKTAQEIRDEIVQEVTVGIDDTGVRAGVIGEIGISERMHPDEEKVLVGAAQAQAQTGLGMHIHIFPWNPQGFPLGLDALRIVAANGAIMEKVAINHVGVALDFSIEYIKQIVSEYHALVEFDNFGHEFYVDKRSRKFLPGPFATDVQRIQAIVQLLNMGYLGNILISSDICHKSLLHRYGGWGYDHVITNVIPMLREYGLSSEQIQMIVVDNPQRFLDSKES
jgi:phosphotriesterase-related protein